MKLDTSSLAHTRWNCKYQIVFAPKYRRQVIYGKIKADIGIMLRKLCEYKQVEILEAEACNLLVQFGTEIGLVGATVFFGTVFMQHDGLCRHTIREKRRYEHED